MIRSPWRFVAALFFAAFGLPVCLPACAVPQFDPTQPASPQTVEQLLAAGHYRRALEQLTAPALAATPMPVPPENAQHDYLLSRIQLGLGQLENSLQLADKALAADPNNAAYFVQVAAVAGRSAEHAGMFKQLAFAKRAHKELEEALVLDPKNPDALYGLMIFADLAPAFIGGDKPRALNLAGELTSIDPARGLLAQAWLAHNRKDYAAEEGFLKSAASASAGSAAESYDAHVAYARFAAGEVPSPPDQARLDIADEQACQALALDPGRSEAWQLLAQMAAASECWLEVDGLLGTARKFDPDDLSPAYFAAVTMIGRGKKLDTADSMLHLYLEKPQEGGTPSEGRARYQLALIQERQGNRDEALNLMRMALAEDPTIEEAKKDVKRLEHGPPPAGR